MRGRFATRTFLVSSEQVRDNLLNAVRNMPIDSAKPLQVLIREEVKVRKLDQQALLFAGPMRDLAEQAWLDNRQFSVEVWHTFCKQKFLPEDFDAELCVEGYVKWGIDPEENRILVGSTKQLTVRGYSQYLEQVFAFGASLGVSFHTNPKEQS